LPAVIQLRFKSKCDLDLPSTGQYVPEFPTANFHLVTCIFTSCDVNKNKILTVKLDVELR